MDNSTINKSSTEMVSFEIFFREEYRAWFLMYLDIAEKLLELEKILKKVEDMKKIFENGRTFESDIEKETAVTVGDFLYYHYGMEWSVNGFHEAVSRLETEFNTTKKLEDSLWEKVLMTGKDAWREDEISLSRLEGKGISCTRTLLTMTPEAASRIKYYRHRLSQKTEESISPDLLEINFYPVYGELLRLAPVAIS